MTNTSGMAAASASETLAGTGISRRSCVTSCSAYAAPDDAHDRVADLRTRNPGTNGGHGARELHPRHLVSVAVAIKHRRAGVQALALQQIGAVERRGDHVDEDLVRTENRAGNVAETEDLGSAYRCRGPRRG